VPAQAWLFETSFFGFDGRAAPEECEGIHEQTQAARRYPTPALEKGLDILELLCQRTGWTSEEQCRAQARPYGVGNLSNAVVPGGARLYLPVARWERFRLTLRLFELAQQYPPTKRMITEALPIMLRVTHELNQSCHLGVLEGDRMVIVAQVASPLSVGFYVKAGGVGDLMRSTTGHVILAHQTPTFLLERYSFGPNTTAPVLRAI
jgi:hypothetical protein